MKIEYWPTQKWQTVEPQNVGMDPDILFELNAPLNTQYKNINGIVVVRNGTIVFERYNHGISHNDPHHVASVTKSILSALVGIAINSGYIENVNQKVLDFFPEYLPDAGDLQKRAVTIKHLLTMTAPFAWKTSAGGNEPLDRLRRQPNWVLFILDLLGRKGQLGKFQYSSVGTHLLSAILTRSTGISTREFANQHLFQPLGMRNIPDRNMKSFSLDDVFGKNVTGWVKDPQGITTGGWGLTLTPRDMARFGFLYLNNGMWDGKQILIKKWIDESTAPNPNGYGYLWWLQNEDNLSTYAALGYGGNCIYCLPQKNLVVTITSELIAKPRDRWQLLKRYIIPAIKD